MTPVATRRVNPDAYTGLKIFITLTVIDWGFKPKFAHRFPHVLDKGQMTRQIYAVFRNALPNEDVLKDGYFLKRVVSRYRIRSENGQPVCLFRQNGDILFVCTINEDVNPRTGAFERQLSVIGMLRIENGRPELPAPEAKSSPNPSRNPWPSRTAP